MLAASHYLLALTLAAGGQDAWYEPFPAHRIAANTYYVGSKDLATYLITTPEGHILINSGFEKTVPLIRASVESLGFKMKDVKILLASHAHSDHVAGHALLQEATGAKVYVMRGDDKVIAEGGKGQYKYTTSRWQPCKVDRVLEDGDEVKLGGVTLIARLTPGHTRGCTTWTWKDQDKGKTYDLVVIGSPNVNPGYQLVDNKEYPEIAKDFAKTFEVLKSLRCDIFLGAHGAYYGMVERYAMVRKGGSDNPFVNPQGYRDYVALKERAFRKTLAEQQEKAAQKPPSGAGLVAPEGADRWERFRGPNGTGTVDDKTIPTTFAADNILWKVALPGAGNGSPIVWGQHLFLQSASKDSKSRTLHCLDTAAGKVLWQRSIPGAPATIRADSSMASSTPTTDGQAVYISFWDGKDIILSAYDFHGETLWSKNLGVFNSQHGPGASPILYKDMLILANDMDKDDFTSKKPNERPSMLMALDKKTGRLLWESPRVAERACYSAPFLLRVPGQQEPVLVVTSSTAVTGYNVETGARLWEHKGWQEHAVKVPMRTVASPALAGDMLCVCSGGDAGRFAIGLAVPGLGKEGGDKNGAPKALWENRKDFPYVPSPVARGEHFYFVNDAGFAGCYHARTGKRVWFERLAEGGFHASPLLIAGNVYAISVAGVVHVFAAEPTFRPIARSELGEVIRATPAVAGGRLYIRGDRHLFCIGKRGS